MKVLLVDDHPLFVEGMRDMLSRNGFTVVGTARDGMEALHKTRSLRPEVVLMDIQMPHCDGLTATRLIKAELPDVKVVMLTMSESNDKLFDAIKSGACGYLIKTLDADEFLQLLRQLAQGEPPFSPGLMNKILQEMAQLPQPVPPPGARENGSELSLRQTQILELVAQGMTYKEVGATLGLTERTIKYHMSEILQRLQLENREQALAYVRRT